jgi:ABC-type multidrug transport system fused ATPase/permease subunit
MEAMERVMAGRTTVMIAHRLSTLEGCDARLVIEHGRIVNAEGRIAYAGLPRLDSRVGQVAK